MQNLLEEISTTEDLIRVDLINIVNLRILLGLPFNAHVYLLGLLVGQLVMRDVPLYVFNCVSYGLHFIYKIILFHHV